MKNIIVAGLLALAGASFACSAPSPAPVLQVKKSIEEVPQKGVAVPVKIADANSGIVHKRASPAGANIPTPETNLAGFASALFSAAMGRKWGTLSALGLIGLVWVLRKWGSAKIPFLKTDRGGAILSLVSGIGLAVAAASTAPGTHSFGEVAGTGLLSAITASGTYSLIRKLLFPSESAFIPSRKQVSIPKTHHFCM